MKIIADENIPRVNEYFGSLGNVVSLPGRKITPADVKDADALIVRSVTQVNETLLKGSAVKFVGTCTIGTDHLDTEWLDSMGISWASAPGCNANSVVEYVFSALAALNVDWRGKSFGIIGCGNVGGALYRRLTSLGLPCVVFDPLLSSEQNADLSNLETVLKADVVCCHAPLTTTGESPSYHLLNAENLPYLKGDAVLINAGRGAVIDNAALLNQLRRRNDLTVVLDVWEGEPEPLMPLLEKVQIATPHIAGYSYDGKVRGAEMIYQALCRDQRLEGDCSFESIEESRLLSGDLSVENSILSAYNIRADDARMREQLKNLQGKTLGEQFDLLRKHYPVRREFHNYAIDSSELLHWNVNQDSLSEKRSLGFKVRPSKNHGLKAD